jgi:two-component system chemotaxis sensor kinase CheA
MDEMFAELLSTFVAESMDFLEEVEPQLIYLAANSAEIQNNPESTGIVNKVFRLVHTIKGNSQIFKIDSVSSLAHHAEGLLDSVRKGKLVFDAPRVDALCRTLDLLRKILTSVEDGRSDEEFAGAASELGVELDLLNDVGEKVALGMDFVDGICWVTDEAPGVAPDISTQAPPPSVPEVMITDEMRTMFVQESLELVETIESALLRLRAAEVKAPSDVEDSFRAMHSFKGNCGFVGLSDMQGLAHAVESNLDEFRTDLQKASADKIMFILEIVDAFRKAVQSMADGKEPVIPDLPRYLTILLSEPSEKVKKATPPAAVVAPASQGAATPAAGAGESSRTRQDVRVDLKKLDSLVDLVGELVIAEAMVTGNPVLENLEDERLEKNVHQLRRITLDLQDVAMSVRMVPVAQTFKKMVRIVHDVAHKTQKKAKLVLLGEETEVDRTVVEKISDPLVHAVRNSIDHGIETPEERVRLGKPESGTVTIEARHESGEVWILIRDDGKGLDKERILKKAIERGIVDENSAGAMSDQQIYDLVFEPGFSTAEKLTDVSGRGVGMDVVRRNIEEVKGHVNIDSVPGQGSTVRIQIPLTLAVIDGMLVRIGKSKYTVPLLAIQESLRPVDSMLTQGPDGQEFVSIRNELIPIIRMYELLQESADCKNVREGACVVVRARDKTMALFVDEILGQQQTVIKAMPKQLIRGKSVSGCTILGNGEISLIVDVGGVSAALRNRYDKLMGARV